MSLEQLLSELGKKGLFVYSDPGAAKNVLAIADFVKSRHKDIMIVSDRRYTFEKEFKVTVEYAENPVEYYFDVFKPDFLFSGTSYTSDIELKYIWEAKKRGIISYSYVDHWTSIRSRFKSKEQTETFPDVLLVIDEKARNLAEAEGLIKSTIKVVGQPYLDTLVNWRPPVNRQEFFSALKVNANDNKIVVYAPDPLTNVNGLDRFGFDEESVADFLLETFSHFPKVFFLVKPHPNQEMKRLEKMKFSNNIIFLDKTTDALQLTYWADLVLGFFSNFLIEAYAMKKPVVRFLPSKTTQDPLAHLFIGQLATEASLADLLKSHLC